MSNGTKEGLEAKNGSNGERMTTPISAMRATWLLLAIPARPVADVHDTQQLVTYSCRPVHSQLRWRWPRLAPASCVLPSTRCFGHRRRLG